MGATEATCVAYMLAMLVAMTALLWRWAKRGELRWNTLAWRHVTHDSRGLGPRKLGIVRLLMAAYVFGTLVAMVLRQPPCSTTFTVWCWALIGLYLFAAGVASCLESANRADGDGEVLRIPSRGEKIVGCFLWVWCEAMFSCAILVFLMVWLALLPFAYLTFGTDAGLLNFLPLSAHNLNVVFMGTEMTLNRLTFVPGHAIFVLFYGTSYVIFSWFYFLFGKQHIFWYFFLDWRLRATPVWYTLLILIIWAAFFGGQKLVVLMKARVHAELPGRAPEFTWPIAEVSNDILLGGTTETP